MNPILIAMGTPGEIAIGFLTIVMLGCVVAFLILLRGANEILKYQEEQDKLSETDKHSSL